MPRVKTGSEPLDEALGGGLPTGTTVLIEGPHGVGSTEFSLALLRLAAASGPGRATFATALRAPSRAQREADELLGPAAASGIRFVPIRATDVATDCRRLAEGLKEGDVLVLESASALARAGKRADLVELVESLGGIAHERRGVLVLLHAPGTLAPLVELSLQEAVDGVFTFAWRDGGPTRRRSLFITKLRGLAPALDGEQVPVFEATLHSGIGFAVSRVRSVV